MNTAEENAFARFALPTVAASALASFAIVFFFPRRAYLLLDHIPLKLLLFIGTWALLIVVAFVTWNILYRHQVWRFIRTMAFSVIGATLTYTGGTIFVIPATVTALANSEAPKEIVDPMIEALREFSTVMTGRSIGIGLAVGIICLVAFAVLYFIVAKDERDNGMLPPDR